ncbi:putative SP-containing membrane protein [Vairimorpha necatrix]|uniref:SP-containing membrane protein n=1 Tax=Vairimorpha necatrix TaxID=6039 RepID=A0AAX4JCP2_9MICR
MNIIRNLFSYLLTILFLNKVVSSVFYTVDLSDSNYKLLKDDSTEDTIEADEDVTKGKYYVVFVVSILVLIYLTLILTLKHIN